MMFQNIVEHRRKYFKKIIYTHIFQNNLFCIPDSESHLLPNTMDLHIQEISIYTNTINTVRLDEKVTERKLWTAKI